MFHGVEDWFGSTTESCNGRIRYFTAWARGTRPLSSNEVVASTGSCNLNAPKIFGGEWLDLRAVVMVYKFDSETNIKNAPCVGENVFLDWAIIVDCGDAPLTFLVRSATHIVLRS
jgi:hypothetical protein